LRYADLAETIRTWPGDENTIAARLNESSIVVRPAVLLTLESGTRLFGVEHTRDLLARLQAVAAGDPFFQAVYDTIIGAGLDLTPVAAQEQMARLVANDVITAAEATALASLAAELTTPAQRLLGRAATAADVGQARAWDALRMQLAQAQSRAAALLYGDIGTLPTWRQLREAFDGSMD
jgi:hypothetical protein